MTRAEAFERFKRAVEHVWVNGAFVQGAELVMSDEPPIGTVLASLAFVGRVDAIGDHLMVRAHKYLLSVSDRLLALPDDAVWKVLVHEAVHMGIRHHGAAFRELCRAKGGSVSESALEDPKTKCEKKVGSRYQVQQTFDNERDGERWCKEQARLEPSSRWRLTFGDRE